MKIFPDTEIYITCPGSAHSGGPELLHQLCSTLLQFGLDAKMLYTSGNLADPVNSVYVKYHLPYVLRPEDKPHNVVVFYETIGPLYFSFKHAQKIFWWLSVDAYIGGISSLISRQNTDGLSLTVPMPKFFYFQDTEKNTEHWVQSEYSRQFIMLNGVHEKNIFVVEDYLSQAFLSKASKVNLEQKENIIAYNPKKGLEVTKKLISLAPNFKWFPIQNMTPEQVQNLLARAKIYIDFGYHPGKDRIPREAAISGCVVITGKRGSAANDIDINIPSDFKFGETEKDFPKIIEKINNTFQNFETAYSKQKAYRERISDDKNRFENEVAEAIGLSSAKKIDAAAIWQGYGFKSWQLMQVISQSNFPYKPKFIVDDSLGNRQFVNGDFITRVNNFNYFTLSKTGSGGVYRLFLLMMQNFYILKVV